MSKKYTFTIDVEESMDEFWEDILRRKVTGCDEVTKLVREALDSYGLEYNLTLSKFTDGTST